MPTSIPYTHLPLPTSYHIRLLEFPGYTDQNEPLEGTLRVVDIDEATVPFVALSCAIYMGSVEPNFSEDFLLDGNGVFRITPRLAAALRSFRYLGVLALRGGFGWMLFASTSKILSVTVPTYVPRWIQ